ncbi:MAG: ABC transporter permease [Thermoguttaceae bacterium]|nr:ABC transporter permease [Thermoguttaceae bacterium]
MFIGPVFTREVTISPRRARTFVGRAVYGGILLLLTATAWLVMTGTQLIVDTGDFSRFGSALFRLIAPLQLMMILFFSAVLAAGGAAREKERKTLVLLLLTRMTNSELVLGKLLASLLEVIIFVLISVPLLILIALFGGVSYPQIFRAALVTLFSALLCGSVGSCIALWRESTFQAISLTVLLIVLWLAVWQLVGGGFFGARLAGLDAARLAGAMSPWRALFAAISPDASAASGGLLSGLAALTAPIAGFLAASSVLIAAVNLLAILRVRVWNPSREARQTVPEDDTWRKSASRAQNVPADNPYDNLTDNLFALEAEHPDLVAANPAESAVPASDKVKIDPALSAAGGKVRPVWNNPIIWREIRTHAYGRRNLIISAVYLLLAAMSFIAVHSLYAGGAAPGAARLAGPLVPLFILSFLLVNAQAVTSLTAERDGGTFVLLLVSDISPKEFVWGKLGGAFYNMRLAVVIPFLLCAYVWFLGGMSALHAFFLFTGLAVLYFFSAMVGVHIGMQYENTRSSLATSLGVIFFLFVGIGTCIWMMLAFSGSFESQLQPFLAFMLGGGIGLYLALGLRNPSSAIALASFILPPATFYAITCFLLGQYHWVYLAMTGASLFTIIAMLIPAIDEFDTVTGRTTE